MLEIRDDSRIYDSPGWYDKSPSMATDTLEERNY